MKVLLDTNTVSYYLKDIEETVTSLKKTGRKNVSVSSVTKYELFYGARLLGSKRLEQEIIVFLADVSVIPCDAETADHAARIAAALTKKGHAIDVADMLIAACAIQHQRTLVSSNLKHFKHIPGLNVISWHNNLS